MSVNFQPYIFYQTGQHYTRTFHENMRTFNEALSEAIGGNTNEFESEENKKINLRVSQNGEWSMKIKTPESTRSLQFQVGQRCEYSMESMTINGMMTREQSPTGEHMFTLKGCVSGFERSPNVPQMIIKWAMLSQNKIVQTSTMLWRTGLEVTGKETYELDYELMYKTDFRRKIRSFIDTKLPSHVMILPFRYPNPNEWCICFDDEVVEDVDGEEVEDRFLDNCSVHGTCDECDVSNSICNCDWWYDQHFCTSCGLNLINCECTHISEIMDKLYEF